MLLKGRQQRCRWPEQAGASPLRAALRGKGARSVYSVRPYPVREIVDAFPDESAPRSSSGISQFARPPNLGCGRRSAVGLICLPFTPPLPWVRATVADPASRAGTRDATTVKLSRSLGLGLYIAREIVLAHGGTVSVKSTGSEGTTFCVRLPRHAAASPSAAIKRHADTHDVSLDSTTNLVAEVCAIDCEPLCSSRSPQ